MPSARQGLAAFMLVWGACDTDQPVFVPSADNPNDIRLVDVTHSALRGWIHPGWSGEGTGVALGDLDGDGDVDMVMARLDRRDHPPAGGPSLLLVNTSPIGGPISFEIDEAFSLLTAGRYMHAVSLADYDADGDLDVFLAGEGADILLENEGSGFRDVTESAGVAGSATDVSVGALWADLNQDGKLDLYVLNRSAGLLPSPQPMDANRLYLSLGDRTFVEAAAQAGVASLGSSYVATLVDLDHDGTAELYVANDTFAIDEESFADFPHDNVYTRDEITPDGVPRYRDVAADWGFTAARASMGSAVADLDGDGFDDIYLTDWGANDLYLWDPELGAYREAAEEMGLALRSDADGVVQVHWGAMVLDLDRNGLLEMFVVAGDVEPAGSSLDTYHQLDQYLTQTRTGGAFVSITESVGLPTRPDPGNVDRALGGRGAFAADFDRDGDDDIVVGSLIEPIRIYENRTVATGNYLRVRPVGNDASPVPAGVELAVTDSTGRQRTKRLIVGGQPFGATDPVLEIALAGAVPVHAELRWPSGAVQELEPSYNREIVVFEPVALP